MNMRKQRLIGALLVIISGIVVAVASGGVTPEDRDATVILLTLPMGFYMIFTKDYVLYDGSTVVKEQLPAKHVDPWAPSNPDIPIDPLYPFRTEIEDYYNPYRMTGNYYNLPGTTKGATPWQEKE